MVGDLVQKEAKEQNDHMAINFVQNVNDPISQMQKPFWKLSWFKNQAASH